MPHLQENKFSSYELTNEETLQGSVLSVLQRQVIQNQIALIAMEKNNLVVDPDKSLAVFSRDEAYKRGQADILQYLKDSSEAAIEELNFKALNPTSE